MATGQYLKDAYLSFSTQAATPTTILMHTSGLTGVSLDVEVTMEKTTDYSDGGYEFNTGTLKSGELTFDANITQALNTFLSANLGTVVNFELREHQTAASASNNKYTGSVTIAGWKPITSKASGGVNTGSYSYPTAGPVLGPLTS